MSAWSRSEIADVCDDLRAARDKNAELTADYNKLVAKHNKILEDNKTLVDDYNKLVADTKKNRETTRGNYRNIIDVVDALRAYTRTVVCSGKLSAADEARGREIMKIAGELNDKLANNLV